MIRKLMMAGLLVMFLSATTQVFAEDVFVTQKGTKYHKAICRLIQNKDGVTQMEQEEAAAADYEPCKRCFRKNATKETNATEKNKEDK